MGRIDVNRGYRDGASGGENRLRLQFPNLTQRGHAKAGVDCVFRLRGTRFD